MIYIKQLDTIRCLAVTMVIISHWFPKSVIAMIIPWGSIGVDSFFVLSGFLITRILLLKKKEIDQTIPGGSRIKAIGQFMMRRSLRIFPIYYLLLLVLYLGASYLPNSIPVDWEYYVLYVQNFLFYFRQSFPGGKLSHLWSLAVEEQFYLIWPWLIFFIPIKYIKHVLISGIIIGASCSVLFPLWLEKREFTVFLTPTCLQAFCLGGFLSYFTIDNNNLLDRFYQYIKVTGLISICVYIVIKVTSIQFPFADRLLIAIFTTWVLAAIWLQKVGWFSKVLDSKALISIGRVSYGIYVYHNFVPVSLKAVIHYLGKHVESGAVNDFLTKMGDGWTFYLLCTFTLLLIAFSSFYIIEKPLLNLKKYFD